MAVRKASGGANALTAGAKLAIVKREFLLYVFVVPAVICTFVFSYLPMFGNYIAFLDYDPVKGFLGLGSPFVGLQNFEKILSDTFFHQLILRTVYYNFIVLIVCFPVPIFLALMINELRSKFFRRVVQTVAYLPYFVSWVTVAALIYLFLSTDSTGMINNILESVFGLERVSYMGKPQYFPAVLVFSHIYKNAGWGTIIFLAAITSVDAQLYEAACMDGAGKWKQLLHVTFPAIMPTIVIMLILNIGGLFSSNFDQVFNLQNILTRPTTNVISVYTFVEGVRNQRYSIAAALGLIQGAASAILIVASNKISKRVTEYGFF